MLANTHECVRKKGTHGVICSELPLSYSPSPMSCERALFILIFRGVSLTTSLRASDALTVEKICTFDKKSGVYLIVPYCTYYYKTLTAVPAIQLNEFPVSATSALGHILTNPKSIFKFCFLVDFGAHFLGGRNLG